MKLTLKLTKDELKRLVKAMSGINVTNYGAIPLSQIEMKKNNDLYEKLEGLNRPKKIPIRRRGKA